MNNVLRLLLLGSVCVMLFWSINNGYIPFGPPQVLAQAQIPKRPYSMLDAMKIAGSPECKRLYENSVDALNEASSYGNREIASFYYSKSAAYGIAYQNCIVRNGK